ncbi:hypothetical protein AC578_10555 [Pseudocercospora eumusae]|uniref:Uncharacterized protein n=1 Tax=Pseudocercospora eumusae TaxID=321146 RepID=A0A139H5C8_9PEZI|nr:hypothetical protein AC578_10555 [Pseudocercospora eumusae]
MHSFTDLFQRCNLFRDPLIDGVSRASFLDHAFSFHLIDQVHDAYREWKKTKQPFHATKPADITAFIDLEKTRPHQGADEWMDTMRKQFSKKKLKATLTYEQRQAFHKHDRKLREKSTVAIKAMYEDFLREKSDPDFDVPACFQIFYNNLTSGLSSEPEVRDWLDGKLLKAPHEMPHEREYQPTPPRDTPKADAAPNTRVSATSRQRLHHSESRRPEIPPSSTRMDPNLFSQSESAIEVPPAASHNEPGTWKPGHEGLRPHEEHSGQPNKPSSKLDIFPEIEEPSPPWEGFSYSDYTRDLPPWTRFSPSN